MRVNFAHIRHPAVAGPDINFAVFEGRSSSGSARDNTALLARLTLAAKGHGLHVDQSALAYAESGQIRFQGSKHLVDFLARSGVPRWTHHLDI